MKVFWQRFIFVVVSVLMVIMVCNHYKGEFDEKEMESKTKMVLDNKEIMEDVVKEVPAVLAQKKTNPKIEKTNLGEFVLTAYCPCELCCGEYALNRPIDENGKAIVCGSIGERLFQGVSVAVDPSVIPYGSKVEIDGEVYIAQDCGGAISGNRIDVYHDSHQDALNFGVQTKSVYIIEG